MASLSNDKEAKIIQTFNSACIYLDGILNP